MTNYIEERNTIEDRQMYELLSNIHDFSSHEEIPYAVVGGLGIQSQLTDLLTNPKYEGVTFESIRDIKSKLPRNEEHCIIYRPTEDIDVVFLTDETDNVISSKLENFLRQTYSDNIRSEPKFLVTENNDKRIRIQLATSADKYRGFSNELFQYQVETADKLIIPYDHRGSGRSTELIVPKKEVLILPKLSRLSESDLIDLNEIVRMSEARKVPIDLQEVRSLAKAYSSNPESIVSNLERIISLN